MERESFEDKEVAELLNSGFISIKVDREERPDVDSAYMSACQIMTGSGGWPLTILMDYEKRPFFAGTYFPKNGYGKYTGFMEILQEILKLWKEGRASINMAQNRILGILLKDKRENKTINWDCWKKALEQLKRLFDSDYGGFGMAPKFPSPHNLMFLLRVFYQHEDKKAFDMVLKTLDNMALGGMYDHIGFGFCRYSTDRIWLAPHFEKMLYDNALLAIAYTEAYLCCGKKQYETVAKQILTYVLRDMTDKEGGFYSAEDADSEGVEGKFYLWDKSEVLEVLGDSCGEKFCTLYDITNKGNFEGENIPNLIGKPLTENQLEFAEYCIEKLFLHRENRMHPLKDKKILTSWNGLMIAAFSICGKAYSNEMYINAAEAAAMFILTKLWDGSQLKTRYCDGDVLEDCFADDYGFMVWGLIELYHATFNSRYLKYAVELNDRFIEDFYDSDGGGMFLCTKDSQQLFMKPKEIYDGAMPSSNSVAIYNLLRLARLTGNMEYERLAVKLLEYFSGDFESRPSAYSFSMSAMLFMTGSQEVVIAANNKDNVNEAVSYINSRFLPFISVVLADGDKDILGLAPYTADYPHAKGDWTAYVCKNNSCSQGFSTVEQLGVNLI